MPAKGWVEVNELYCKACELCVTDCPTQTLALDMSRLSAKGFHPAFMVHPENCTGCGICATVCPDAAITVFRGVRLTQGEKGEA
jgi:2-oxoglutarate ferredoxin oxidoreductase subunit delta